MEQPDQREAEAKSKSLNTPVTGNRKDVPVALAGFCVLARGDSEDEVLIRKVVIKRRPNGDSTGRLFSGEERVGVALEKIGQALDRRRGIRQLT